MMLGERNGAGNTGANAYEALICDAMACDMAEIIDMSDVPVRRANRGRAGLLLALPIGVIGSALLWRRASGPQWTPGRPF